MPREHPRKLRVAAELQRAANELLAHDVNDPRLTGVRISAVELSGDLSLARLFFNPLDPDDDPAPIEAAFESAAGFFRSQLGRAVRLRRVPALSFVQDLGPRRGMELTHLIDEVVDAEPDTHDDGTDQKP